MKRLSFLVLLWAFLSVGCGLSRSPGSSLSSSAVSFQPRFVAVPSDPELFTLKSPEVAVTSEGKSGDEDETLNPVQGAEEDAVTIPAPPNPRNPPRRCRPNPETRALMAGRIPPQRRRPGMKRQQGLPTRWSLSTGPCSASTTRCISGFSNRGAGIQKSRPEAPRVGVNNFFSNLKSPIRFVSCLLQADFSCAVAEFGRFAVNTIWGVGGLLDPASSKQLNIPKNEADLGQTLEYMDWDRASTLSGRSSDLPAQGIL